MAGTSSRSDSGKKKARIEIIPLIDVIFFLLATFVLFTLSLNKIAAITVVLPKASPPNNQPPDPELVTLQVSDQGTCYWNKELIDFREIAPRLTQLKTQFTNPKVLIAGDSKAKFGAAVAALDEVRKAEIAQVSVETSGGRATGK